MSNSNKPLASQIRSKKAPRGRPFPKGASGNPDRQFKPGTSGNAGGRPRKAPITDELRRILEHEPNARKAAWALFKLALKGNVSAFREIADRVEGKSTERVEWTGADGEAIQFKSDNLDERILELAERIRSRQREVRKSEKSLSDPANRPN